MTQETELQNENEGPDIGAILKKFVQPLAPVEDTPPKKPKNIEESSPSSSKKETVKEESREKEFKSKNIQKDEEKSETSIDWKSEIEKLQHNLKETRKWGDETNRQLSSYKKTIEKFKEEGNLTEEEASELLNHTKYQELENKNKSFIEKAGEVWNREIENIRKYSDYPDLDKHLQAFQHFIHYGSQVEVDEAYNDIKDLVDSNPILFTKKMLEIGKRYNDEIFNDLVDAGNLKNFKMKYEEKLESSQKKIEKLEKEIEKLKDKYEGYDDNPNYRLPQGGESAGGYDSASIRDPGALIEKFNQGRHRFPR